jgi:ferric-dicitrate binding protein FerR (iron transport regulator)/tetratricopeptide (TPR) repeat protein
MDCQRATALLSAELDRELQPQDRTLLDAHLLTCPRCQAMAEDLRRQHAGLQRLYASCSPSAGVVAQRVLHQLTTLPAVSQAPRRRPRRVVAWALTAAALVSGMGLLLYSWERQDPASEEPAPIQTRAPDPQPHAEQVPQFADDVGLALPPGNPIARTSALLGIGESIQTQARERRRYLLPGDSVLYVNQNSAVLQSSSQKLTLSSGEVFVEVTTRAAESGGRPLVVQTAGRVIAAFGAKFAVRATAAGANVVVVQGQVRVSNLDFPLRAGQQLAPGLDKPRPAPPTSDLLDWTRDLMVAADPPLVSANPYAGGVLVTRDRTGQETRLSLRKYHVDVHIEDGFARTTIDQTYFNHEIWRTEGTFYFPLPPDASLSRLAMYVDGKLMEGGMAERDYARQVFESILDRRRDPALLEWVDGSTFKMRVFPLEGRQEKRIILSYTQRLESLDGHTRYRFPAGHSLERVSNWSFHARIARGATLAWESITHELVASQDGADLLLDGEARNVLLDRDVALEFHDSSIAAADRESTRFSSAEQEGARYLMLRYRPTLPNHGQRQPRDWIFLVETSGDRNPLLARTQVEIVLSFLANVEPADTFTLLTAGTRARPFQEKPLAATPQNIHAAVAALERTHLIGALDLGQALAAVEPFAKAGRNPYLVHVGSGLAGMGERRAEVLARRLPEHVRYVGVAVGKRWSRAFMKAAAERSDGYFTQINPDEPAAWRTFDLASTLNAPRLLDVKVSDPTGQAHFLTWSAALAQGEELCAIARLGPEFKGWPAAVTVSGRLDGKEYRQVVPVRDVRPDADYLPRTWARLEIDRLLAEDAARNRERIVDLSRAMYVMTPYTSLLVLENEEMYKEYKVDRGRKDHWAMYPCPAQIPVVREPDSAEAARSPPAAGGAGRPGAEQVLETILIRVPPPILWRHAERNEEPTSDYLTAREIYTGRTRSPEFEAEFVSDIVTTPFMAGATFGTGSAPTHKSKLRSGGTPDIQEQITEEVDAGGFLDADTLRQMRQLRERLSRSITLPAGIEAGSKFQDALDFFSDQYDIPIVVDTQAFRLSHRDDFVHDKEVKLPRMVNVSLGTVLRQLTAQVDGVYLIRRNYVEITTPERAAAERRRNPYLLDSSGAILGRDGRFSVQTGYVLFEAGPANYGRWPAASWTHRGNPLFGQDAQIRQQVDSAILAVGREDWARPQAGLRRQLLAADRLELLESAARQRLKADGLSEADAFAARLIASHPYNKQAVLYERPSFSGNGRVFGDLTVYAPGMNTMRADILAVLEAEAQPDPGDVPGRVDPGARQLIERARAFGWRSATIPGSGLTVVFDGLGRFVYERRLPTGLREQVLCDGRTLWHLYPELGIGARRVFSRFHRAEFTLQVPFVLPPVEDLAHGADLRCVNEHTVAIVPRRSAHSGQEIHLGFAKDGRLAERRLVEIASKTVLVREHYGRDGSVTVSESKDKEIARQKIDLREAKEPRLTPDTQNLIVLPLPLRSRGHVLLQANHFDNRSRLTLDGARALLAAAVAMGDSSSALQLFRQHLQQQDIESLGYYVLLSAAGVHLVAGEDTDVAQVRPQGIETQYLAAIHYRPSQRNLNLGKGASRWQGFLQRLLDLRALWNCRHRDIPKAELEAIRRRVEQEGHDAIGWAVLGLLQDRSADGPDGQSALAVDYQLFADVPGLGYEARYEVARGLLLGDHRQEAGTLFQELFTTTWKKGSLPLIDRDFRRAMQRGTGQPNTWAPLMHQAAQFIKNRQRSAAVSLAWQCWEVGDQTLAANLLALALDNIHDDQERLQTTLAGIEYLWLTDQLQRAEELLGSLLADSRFFGRSPLWRMGAALAAQRRQSARAVECLERAVELDFRNLWDRMDLEAVRNDFTLLLGSYQQTAEALTALKAPLPPDLVARVVRNADRWRALDPDNPVTCTLAAQILYKLGARDVAWEYLNTPVAVFPPDPDAWSELAEGLRRQEDFELAARAYEQAFEAEPSNAQLLWDWAQALERAGQQAPARQLYRKLVAGPWEPRFRWIQEEASRK